MDVNVYLGLSRALQTMALPASDAAFDGLLAQLEAVELRHRSGAAAMEPRVLQRSPLPPRRAVRSRLILDRRAIARLKQRKIARHSLN